MKSKQSLSEKKQMLNVPYEICRYTTHNGIFRQASVYFFLKYHCDGLMKIDSWFINTASSKLGISQRTVVRAIEWLKKERWIINRYGKVYRIVSFNRIFFQVKKGNSKTGVLWEKPNFSETKAFVIAACAKKLLQDHSVIKRVSGKGVDTQTFLPKWIKEAQAQCINGSFDFGKLYLSKFYFAMRMEIALTTAYEYLNIAVEHGFLEKTRNSLPIKAHVSLIRNCRKFFSDELTRKVWIVKGKAWLLLPNSYECDLVMRKRIKLTIVEKKFGL